MATVRYWTTTPVSGVNVYQAYAPATPPGLSQIAQLGVVPGTVFQGNLNTRWMYATNGATPVVANTAINIDPITFAIGGTGGIAGKSLIAVPALNTAWYEVSGATLNLTALAAPVVRAKGENDADFTARVVAAHAAVGENPDGTPLHPVADPHAKAEHPAQANHAKADDKGAKK
jgi:hypothetical protein